MDALVLALVGGAIIGLSAAMLLAFNGRIAGISGIVGGFFEQVGEERSWRGMFIAGLLLGGVAVYLIAPELFGAPLERSTAAVIVAGLLVGYGTRLSSGCTSGHGICGVSRFSIRSIVAVLTFVATGVVTVYVIQNVFGGTV